MKTVSEKIRNVIIVTGIPLLGAAIFLDKHSLFAKGFLSLLIEVLTMFLFLQMYKKMVLRSKHFIPALFIVISIGFYIFLFFKFLLVDILNYRWQMLLILEQIPSFLLLLLYAISWSREEACGLFYQKFHRCLDSTAFFSMMLTIGLIVFFSPLTLHLSDPSSLSFPFIQLLLWHGLYFMIGLALAYLSYTISPPFMKPVLMMLFLVTGIFSWIYTYILPGDYGVLDVVFLSKPGKLIGLDRLYGFQERLFQIGELIVLSIGAFLIILIGVKFIRRIFPLVVILNLMVFGQMAFNIVSRPGIWAVGKDVTESAATYLPDAATKLYRFSRKGNILIFMLDMFHGDLVRGIFQNFPELEKDFQGFIWYPSTLPVGTATFAGLPAILAGEDYSPHRVNQRKDRLMSDMMEEAYSFYPKKARELGYDCIWVNPVYFNLDVKSEAWNLTSVNSGALKEYWLNSSPEASDLNLDMSISSYSRLFSVIGLFKASPFFLRPYIYLEGRWLMQNRGNLEANHAITHLSVLDLFDSLSFVDDGPPSFKFIDNELTHSPWAIGDDLKLSKKASHGHVINSENNLGMVEKQLPYNSSARALKEIAGLLAWMRKEGIYDNSRIILVSDHGYNGINESWKDVPVIRSKDGENLYGTARANSLLMVKDFDSQGSFRIDNRLMTTADTPLIAFADPRDPTKGKERKRSVYFSVTRVPPEENGKYQYIMDASFEISGNPSRPENWIRLK